MSTTKVISPAPESESEDKSGSNSKRMSSTKEFNDMEESEEPSNLTNPVVSKEIVQKAQINTEENKENEIKICDKENHNPQINQDQTEENVKKKRKMKRTEISFSINLRTKKVLPVIKTEIKRCNLCKQKLDDATILYQGHPNGAMEEQIALTDSKLCIFTGDEDYIHESDIRPQNKLTYFSVYDKKGHMCPFDTGLIEKNVNLYFSGYMKSIFDEDPSPEEGVPTKDMGPIIEWYITGFDGGELAVIGFSTAFAEYILMEPSEAYAPFIEAVKKKIYMSKLAIEFLLDETSKCEDPKYEDLVNKLQTVVPPKGVKEFTEDMLLYHAQFICNQVLSFDDTADADDVSLITTSCMRDLVRFGNVTLGKQNLKSPGRRIRCQQKIKKPAWTKATTTKLVSNIFENMFTNELAKHDDAFMKPRRQRCGVCENCQQPDCGTCSFCKDMLKFGGTGKIKQACAKRKCANMAIQEADDFDQDTEMLELKDEIKEEKLKKEFNKKYSEKNIIWEKEDKIVDEQKTYYKSVMVGNERIQINDFVLVEPKNPTHPLYIYKIIFMYEDKNRMKQFHGNWLCRGTQTILGETSDPTELFQIDDCDDISFTCVKSKATVIHKKKSENWSELGNKDIDDEIKDTDNNTYFYQMRYTPETGRFEDPLPDPECSQKEKIVHRFCPVCTRALEQYNTPKISERIEKKSNKEVIYGVIKYRGEEYRVGNAVFLYPSAFDFKYVWTYQQAPKLKKEDVDEDMYPEFYRKFVSRNEGKLRNTNLSTSQPFHIGYINAIYANTTDQEVLASNIYIKVNKMYRPENTHRDSTLMEQADLNMVYWSDEVHNVKFFEVAGKCYLAYSENLSESVEEWSMCGPNRFYFSEAYNAEERTFDEPPYNVMGKSGKGKGKGKGKAKKEEKVENKSIIDEPVDYPTVKKLKTLDIFAGCGGLSEGLHQAEMAECLWAIEKDETAAHAYRLNNPKAIVFTDDCNTLLQKVMNGDSTDDKGQKLPQKGEVELLCGGPPCQGFSGMNRFNSRQYSLFKNSLVVSCLSYCDYYRPKFFIMENVHTFVCYNRHMVLKLTLRCLVRMGYQCTFGILQAGNYGVPQSRRRLIILAAASGEILPKYPEPTHVFKQGCTRAALVDNKKYQTNCVWTKSAPFRTITVKDAMCDLPNISNGWNTDKMSYNSEPLTHFQRKMRGKQYQPIVRDHICKNMKALAEARIAYIPIALGCDWRDLPNIVVQLSDGTFSQKLKYTHHDENAGKSSTGALRGVCSCSTGKACDPSDRQFNTLIPWCLPHTGNRNNNWTGLYGRLEWDGCFSTTVTNPEPMGKQGRVLHPTQNRVVSVRECARSQGFRDSFLFYGTILDKHRQIGNAVPPPLGTAIGHEIRKCIRDTTVL